MSTLAPAMRRLTKCLIFVGLISDSAALISWEGDDAVSLLQLHADRKRMEADQPSPGCLDAKQWHDLHASSFTKKDHAPRTSQGNQDQVLHSLFGPHHLGVTNKFYVEFGFNQDSYDEVGSGPNTERLLKQYGWSGLEMDGSHENATINLRKEFITRDNVASLFNKYSVPKEPDYVSIDIDSCDLWVFLGIMESEFRPRVFTVEYNAYWPLEKSVTNVCKRPDGQLYRWHGDNMHGASLAALNKAANDNGYTIVYVTKVLDAFMVRKDLICPGTELPIEIFRDATGLTKEVHKNVASPEELAMWMQDY